MARWNFVLRYLNGPSARGHSDLTSLIVSPERLAWILARYPETDTGRPGILATDQGTLSSTRWSADADSDEPATTGTEAEEEEASCRIP